MTFGGKGGKMDGCVEPWKSAGLHAMSFLSRMMRSKAHRVQLSN
jgi:hypothetical protein